MENKYIVPNHRNYLWKVQNDDIKFVDDPISHKIHSIWLADEDLPLEWYDNDNNKHIVDVKAGDIVIAFYDADMPNRVIAVHNEDWKENYNVLLDKENKRKAEWAAKNACSGTEICCDSESICR